jgi:hypothetical protein
LKQIDLDGSFLYSQVILVENFSITTTSLNFYPNPTQDVINFEFTSPFAGKIKLEVVNVLGEILDSDYREVTSGTSKVTASLSNYPVGIYYLRISGDEFGYQCVKKVMKY